jgi:hypothetical protein
MKGPWAPVMVLVLVVIAVGVFLIVGNTHHDDPQGPSLTQYMCGQPGSGC